jgi:hypothetical protein
MTGFSGDEKKSPAENFLKRTHMMTIVAGIIRERVGATPCAGVLLSG